MPTYSKSGAFGYAGGGKSGAIVDLWAADRFTGPPGENQAPPSGLPDAGPVTTGPSFGSPGGFVISNVPSVQDYYTRVQYGGLTFWGFCAAATLSGVSEGGGGGSTVVALPFNYTTPATFTPTVGTIITDWWIDVNQAWNGLVPNLDVGTFSSGHSGLLVGTGLSPFSLQTVDGAVSGNAGLIYGATGRSWSAALATGALTNGPPVARAELTVGAPFPITTVVSQDGTTQAAVGAQVISSGGVSSATITTGVNDTFLFLGATNASGGGTGTPETFTIPAGVYGSGAAIATAMGLATGSVSGELFSTICTVIYFSGTFRCRMLRTGAGNNGNQLQAGPTDALATLAFTAPALFSGGVGGDPESTQGTGVLYLAVAETVA